MSRPIVLSNGELHVGLNSYGLVHDFYYPYVGSENHTSAKKLRHRIGVRIDGNLSWLDDGSWSISSNYHTRSLIGHTIAISDDIGISIIFDDFVNSADTSFIRNVQIINHLDVNRTISIFFHQVFVISDSYASDTAQYLPNEHTVIHYKGNRYFAVGAQDSNRRGFDQWSVGLFGIEGKESTYCDADDGELSKNSVEHGRVDSTIRLSINLAPHDSSRIHYWVAAARTQVEVIRAHKRLVENGVSSALEHTHAYWHKWVNLTNKSANALPGHLKETLVRSVLLAKSHIDNRGAVMASTDTTMFNYERDSYAYCWPRDAAYVVWPLIRLGYKDEALKLFEFCRRGLNTRGYLMHKYQSDGAVGSSWHPYIFGDEAIAPIQEDETAIIVYLFSQYYDLHQDDDLLDAYYRSMILPMANFMAEYIDNRTKLPKPSYDLWEEKYLTTTYSTAVVYASLLGASRLADQLHDTQTAVRWRNVADDIKTASRDYLYNPTKNFFYKGIRNTPGGIEVDDTIDVSSFYGITTFGLFETTSEQVEQSYHTLGKIFADHYPALPRYENDKYHHTGNRPNDWFITTLWHAQYLISIARTGEALEVIDWVTSHSLTTGVLSEQVKPDGLQTSVAPLAWSQSELAATLLDLASSLSDEAP